MKCIASLCLCVAFVMLSVSVNGELAVTNGDFEDFAGNTATGGGQYAHVTAWYDPGQWSTWQQDGTRIDPSNGTAHVAAGPNGYIYQSLGTYTAAHGSILDYSFETNKFSDGNGSAIMGVDIFAGSFTAAADGTDILGHAGQPSLVHHFSNGQSYLDWEALGNSGSWIITDTVDLTGIADDTELWIRIGYLGASGGNGYSPVDTVSISPRTLPFIVQQPEDVLAEVGDTIQLVVVADNPLIGSLTYQWYQGVSPDPSNPIGTNLPALTVTDVQDADFDRYYCRVSNVEGYTDSVSGRIIKKQLLAHWQFDGQGGSPEAGDSTGNGYDGQLVGSPSLIEGQINNALDFGIDEYVTIPKAMDQSSLFSLSAWINTSNEDAVLFHWLFDDGSTGVMRLAFGRLEFVQTTHAGQEKVNGYNTLRDANWHHAAMVYDRGLVTLYVDGLKAGSSAMSMIAASGATMTIASQNGTAGLDFQGRLDDVRLYSYPRTPTEMALLYTAVEGAICATAPLGDLTGDCSVNFDDLAALAYDWLKCTELPECP